MAPSTPLFDRASSRSSTARFASNRRVPRRVKTRVELSGGIKLARTIEFQLDEIQRIYYIYIVDNSVERERENLSKIEKSKLLSEYQSR